MIDEKELMVRFVGFLKERELSASEMLMLMSWLAKELIVKDVLPLGKVLTLQKLIEGMKKG